MFLYVVVGFVMVKREESSNVERARRKKENSGFK